MMQEKTEGLPVMETMKLEKGKKKNSKKIPWGWILLVLLVAVELWFFSTWKSQQKVADDRMERLIETVTIKEAEELTEAEMRHLFESYENAASMTSFKEERQEVFLDRVSSVTGLVVQDVVLTKHQEDDGTFLQLCFVCGLEDKVSDSVLYAYRYYEDGGQEKYICYAYDTVKSKLFGEDGTGMTAKYYDGAEELLVSNLSRYDEALCVVLDGPEKEY